MYRAVHIGDFCGINLLSSTSSATYRKYATLKCMGMENLNRSKLRKAIETISAAALLANVASTDKAEAQWSSKSPDSRAPIAGPERAGTIKINLLESRLTEKDMLDMRKASVERMSGNIAKTWVKIPKSDAQERFLGVQNQYLAQYEKSPIAIRPTSKADVDRLKAWAPRQLEELFTRMKEGAQDKTKDGSFAILVNADQQEAHLVHRINGRLEFLFSSKATTGGEGIAPNPPPESKATASGLNSIKSITKDHVVFGEDVSYQKEHAGGEHLFEIEGPSGLKPMYIAPPGYATVAIIGFYFYTGQAFHNGPIKQIASSNGCVRLPIDMLLAIDGYLSLGSSVLIHGAGAAKVPEVAVEERSKKSGNSEGAGNADWAKKLFDQSR